MRVPGQNECATVRTKLPMHSLLTDHSRALAWAGAIGVASASCGGSQPGPDPSSARATEHEVFCMGSPAKCDATASTFCRSRYQTDAFTLVRRIPERGSLIVICGAD